MPDNIVPVGNTPIFDQLVREMAAKGIRFQNLLARQGVANLEPVQVYGITASEALRRASEGASQVRGCMVPSSWIAKNVPHILPEENPKIAETFDPVELIEKAINPDLHVSKMVDSFVEKFPNVTPVHIVKEDNIDGTVTVTVMKGGTEQAAEFSEDDHRLHRVRSISEVLMTDSTPFGETFKVHGEAATMPPVFRTASSIGEDSADALYMKTSTWGSDEE